MPRAITIVALALVMTIPVAGCSSTSKTATQPSAAPAPVTMASLAGHWQGYVTSAGNSSPMDVQVNPDGTFVSRLGAFTGTGSIEITGGTIYTVGQMSGPTQGPGKSEVKLTQKDGKPRLTGDGENEDGSPYSFRIDKR
jgi:hypothetical protein